LGCSPCANTPQCTTCSTTNPNMCLNCSSGYFVNSATSLCQACPSFCSNCTSAAVCIEGNYISGYSLMTINGQPTLGVCDPGCYQCSTNNPSSCTTCLPGFYLSTTITGVSGVSGCVPCNPSCQYCTTGSPNSCTSCFPGAILTTNNQCTACPSTCLSCYPSINNSSILVCSSCPTGSIVNSNANACISVPNTCGQNCLSCSGNACTVCRPGSVPINGQCVLCPVGCGICSASYPSICLACAQGNYYDFISQGCIACSANCATCNAGGCQTCIYNYTLTATFTCAPRCFYPCAACIPGQPDQCTQCVAGFTNSTSSLQNCVPIVTGNNCTVCSFGYSLLINNNATAPTQKCVPCATASNCARCNPTNTAVCFSCRFGTYLNSNNICVACPSGCTNCYNPTTCFACGPGYVALLSSSIAVSLGTNGKPTAKAPFALTYQPVSCSACVSPCQTCYNNPNTCLTCVQGYTFNNNLCISNFNFGLNFVLSMPTSQNSQFANNYYNFLTSISNSINVPLSSLSVTNIIYGSVTINLGVSTTAAPGSSTASTQQQNLNNLVHQSSIAGMTVGSGALTVNGNPPPAP